MTGYVDLRNLSVVGRDGVVYAYRDTEGAGRPLVLLQHFRGNLDNWDPPLIDALSDGRRVVTFDNAGVGATTGVTPSTIAEMARGALTFIDALGLDQVDLLGFSIGSFVAQEIALSRPSVVKRVVFASAAPRGAPGMHGWADDVISAVGQPEPNPDGYLSVFFTQSDASRAAGVATLGRIFGPKENVDTPTTWETRLAQYDAVCSWGVPNHSLLQRLTAIHTPVFIAAGDSDPMILPRYSYLLAGLIPNSRLKIYPDAGHGFLFQHHAEFADDVKSFLDNGDLSATASQSRSGCRLRLRMAVDATVGTPSGRRTTTFLRTVKRSFTGRMGAGPASVKPTQIAVICVPPSEGPPFDRRARSTAA